MCDEEGTLDCPQHESGAGGEDEECCGSGSGCGSGDEETTTTTLTTTTTVTTKIISTTTTEQYACQDGSMISIAKVCNLYWPRFILHTFSLLFGYHYLILSSPRAESARAITGRRCPHCGVGEDFLACRL